MLTVKGINFRDQHGVSGEFAQNKMHLANEKVKFKGAGVIPELAKYLGEAATTDEYSLKEMFANMAFIHRAYCQTYVSNFLFVPINEVTLVKSKGRKPEGWLQFKLNEPYTMRSVVNSIPSIFEKDISYENNNIFRTKKRFSLQGTKSLSEQDFNSIQSFNSSIRHEITYIAGTGNWYLKRNLKSIKTINRHTATLIIASMHRLSELSRYNPTNLANLLKTQSNWLISEFVRMSALQFIDEIASEITGEELHTPMIHKGNFLHD